MKNTLLCLFWLLVCTPIFSQKNKIVRPQSPPTNEMQPASTANIYDNKLLETLRWRNIGPFRGGRSAAVTGVAGKPNLFYFGGTGGGVWRTTDGGRVWENISDGFFGGSIGAIEVAPSDPNVIYVGGGESTVRGNVAAGSGMWKSEDAGKTWKNVGLRNSRHIPRIKIHPKNSDIVYAAVLGDLFKSSDERGVFRSTDGGKTWQKVLFTNPDAGAVDICLDPTNPRIIFASTWRVRRTPHSLSSGGDGSKLWKSTDSGDTWMDLTASEGLPKDTIGIIGVAVSPARPERVWAIIESKTGGVFRSDDGGKKWTKINEDRSLRQRAWYYTRIYADTEDENTCYVVNVAYHKSTDGGKTFSTKYAPHGDHHDLWIAPENPKRMIIGDDGGAQTTYDGGETWSTYHNQPTAQYYRVSTDNSFPYRIYVAQQDNTSIRVRHRSAENAVISEKDWEPTAGGESGHIVADPSNNDIVYGGEYHGLLTRYDHLTQSTRAVNVWPEDNMGHGAEDAKYRFQWNFPLFFSPHDPRKLYACSNHLHASTDGGQSWQTLSPDLTTNDKSRQKSSGGPITQDNTGVEYYCTIFAAAESPRKAGEIWVGTDDGLVQLTRDGGKNWQNITPAQLPKWTMINCLESDPHRDGACYLAATSYKNGDYQPLLFRTENFGATWEKITEGIEKEHFTRAIRADRERAGLLYAGTEQGMYVSFDDGKMWQPLQLNLPIVPITDIALKDDDLIAATQGRSLWIIDDLSPLRQLSKEIASKKTHLFKPGITHRTGGGYAEKPKTAGENHPAGAVFHFYQKEKLGEKDTARLEILEVATGKIVKTFSTHDDKNKLKIEPGGNRFIWDLRYPDAEKFDGMVLWSYGLQGARAVPGNYKVKLTVPGSAAEEQNFEIKADPRSKSTPDDFQKQFDFTQSVGAKLTEAHLAIKEIRDLREQIKTLKSRYEKDEKMKSVLKMAAEVDSAMTKVEQAIYQTKNQSPQDPLNFPVRLNDKLANLMGLNVGDDYPPTEQAKLVRDQLFFQTDEQLRIWKALKSEKLPALNRAARAAEADFLRVKETSN